MKRIFTIFAICTLVISAHGQTGDTIWTYDFNGEVDAAYWNYETRSITDLVLYRPENVTYRQQTLCLACKYDYFDGYRFTSAGLNTQNKVMARKGRSVEFVAAMPTGAVRFLRTVSTIAG